MKRVNILDCTLRDGAYLIDSHFYLQTKGIHLMSALPITADTILIT